MLGSRLKIFRSLVSLSQWEISSERTQCFRLQTTPLITELVKIKINNTNNSDGNSQESKKMLYLATAPTFLAFFKKKDDDEDDLTFLEKIIPKEIRILFQKEDESPEGRLVMTLKRSIYLMQLNKMQKAEQMIHLALRMAQDIKHIEGITLCFDIMANLAMEMKQYEKSEKLFVAVIQRLFQAGTEQDDIKVLHISLKISQIAEYTGNYEKAEQGYKWVFDNLLRKYELNKKDTDMYELIGLASNYYGKFSLRKLDFPKARDLLKNAYEIYTDVHEKENPEVVDLLNNLAVACTNMNELEAAEKYINEAIRLAQDHPHLYETGVYHANRGLIYLKKGLTDAARKSCTIGQRLATKSKSENGLEQVKYCFEEIDAATSTAG